MSTMNSPTTLAKSDVSIPRSVFGINNEHLTSASAGYLYPIYCAEVLPGDSCRMDLSFLTRMNTPIHPTMGNAYQDIAFFFVPNRIIWDDFKFFFGESPSDPYINPIEYKIPTIRAHVDAGSRSYETIIPYNSILDFIGLPAGNNFYEFNALPIRAFCTIWNEWWRDQNLQHAIDVPRDSIDRDFTNIGLIDLSNFNSEDLETNLLWNQDAVEYYTGDNLDFYITSSALGGVLPPVSKFHDLFTSATLQAQKGDPVPIPINSFNAEWLPVMTRSEIAADSGANLRFNALSDDLNSITYQTIGIGSGGYAYSSGEGYSESESNIGIYPSNLWAKNQEPSTDLYSTINDLRYAFAVQKYLELDNFGTRYRELLYNHFKVLSPDASMQIPEFLGAKTFRIGMQQVVQTSGTTANSPQGNLAAYSMTADSTTFFSKSFTEHGWIIGVTCIRSQPEYEQGAERFWRYREKLEIYSPEFSNVGDIPIFLSELWNPDVLYDRDADTFIPFSSYFGFSEAHYQYRQKTNHISGMMRTNRPGSMAYWHYGEYYETQPYLNDEFIRQKRTPIGKTLAGGDNWLYDQFICDYKFKPVWTRPVPVYSSPWFGGRL